MCRQVVWRAWRASRAPTASPARRTCIRMNASDLVIWQCAPTTGGAMLKRAAANAMQAGGASTAMCRRVAWRARRALRAPTASRARMMCIRAIVSHRVLCRCAPTTGGATEVPALANAIRDGLANSVRRWMEPAFESLVHTEHLLVAFCLPRNHLAIWISIEMDVFQNPKRAPFTDQEKRGQISTFSRGTTRACRRSTMSTSCCSKPWIVMAMDAFRELSTTRTRRRETSRLLTLLVRLARLQSHLFAQRCAEMECVLRQRGATTAIWCRMTGARRNARWSAGTMAELWQRSAITGA